MKDHVPPPPAVAARNGTHRPGTVADALVATLRASGVRRVHGPLGGGPAGLADAVRQDGELAWEPVRHEASAAFAAAGEAALTGELAVCAGGGARLVDGLFEAQRDGVPVLALVADAGEADPRALFGACSVFAERVSDPERLPRVLERALRHALERHGVAVVAVPGAVLLAPAGEDAPPRAIRAAATVARPGDAAILAAADLLNAAGRVTILAGAGCRDAHDALIALAGRLQAPIVHTARGREWVAYDNPYDIGMAGPLGLPSGDRALEHCDVLLMLGTGFPYRRVPADGGPQVVQVDHRGERLGRRVAVDRALLGTVKDTIDALLPRLSGGRDTAHLDLMLQHDRTTRMRFDRQAEMSPGAPIHPQALSAAIDRLAAYDAVFLPDAGPPALGAARHLTMNGRRRLIGPSTDAGTADALPRALGAQASHPGRQVIALAGDDLPLGELITLRRQRLPIKMVVYNNGPPGDPSLAEIAWAIGLHAVRIERPADLEAGLRDALDAPGPALADVLTTRQDGGAS
jgi:pyruvate dehydrogenase (quinone)